VITKEEMSKCFEEGKCSPCSQEYRNYSLCPVAERIRALIESSALEVKRVSVTMGQIDEVVGYILHDAGENAISVLFEWLRSLGVEVTPGEVVDGGKPEKEKEDDR
jgi:hypothetical protein